MVARLGAMILALGLCMSACWFDRLPRPPGDGALGDDGLDQQQDLDAPDAPDAVTSCETLYGNVTGFELCSETASTCVFYRVSDPSKGCAAICLGVCLSSNDNLNGVCTVGKADPSCGVTHYTSVCTCQK